MQELILLGVLLVISREDLRTGQISGEWLVLLAMLSVVKGITSGMVDSFGLITFLPGFLLCLISWVSHGSIGMGDGYLFWALGFCLQPLLIFRILMDSFTLAGVYALGISIQNRIQRKNEVDKQAGFAMVPFITVAVAGAWGRY